MSTRDLAPVLSRLATFYPVVTLTGPRQSGKTTLCKTVFPDKPYLSLEAMDARTYAREDPRGFLAQFPEGAVLDEVLAAHSQGLAFRAGDQLPDIQAASMACQYPETAGESSQAALL